MKNVTLLELADKWYREGSVNKPMDGAEEAKLNNARNCGILDGKHKN